MEISASVPAKVILFGEHAVVYGVPAIAASINRRTTVTLRTVTDKNLSVKLLNLSVSFPLPLKESYIDPEFSQQQQQAFQCIKIIYDSLSEKCKAAPSGLALEVTSDFPVGAGLGSSAGFSLSVSSVFLAYDCIINETSPFESDNISASFHERLKTVANECEKVFHGNPSGIDISTCTLGGIIKFQKNEPVEKLADSLPLKIAVVDTKISRNTSNVVKEVAELFKRLERASNGIIDNIRYVVDSAVQEIKNPEPTFKNLMDLVRINHGLLYALGVSHSVFEQIGLSIANLGVSFKLTGAGRGGNALIFIPPTIPVDSVSEALSKEGFEASIVDIGVPGLTLTLNIL